MSKTMLKGKVIKQNNKWYLEYNMGDKLRLQPFSNTMNFKEGDEVEMGTPLSKEFIQEAFDKL